jgi:transposase
VSPYFVMFSNDKETINKSSGRFISFIKHAFSRVQSSHLSLYSSKYSRRDYTQHQLLTIILFKEYRKEDYRTIIWDLEEMDRIREILGLTTMPHFTTIQKFLCRIKPIYFDILLKSTLKLFYFPDDTIPITAIDSSGFTSGYCSHYYSERIGKIRKHFLKTSIVVDIDQQVITGFMISKSRVHDSQHAFPLLKKCHKSECYLMDRGYDSEKMHRFIRETLKADSIIPARSWKNTENIWGKYRKEMTNNFDFIRYRKRFLVETKFSVLKRRFGADLKSRIFQIQKKEISCKIILANLDRFIQFVWTEVFYRAEKNFRHLLRTNKPYR